MEKNVQQKNSSEKIYTAGEVGMLLENIDDGIKALSDGHKFLKENMERIEKKIEEIDKKLDIKAGIEVMNKVDNHEQRLVKLEKIAAVI